MKKKYKEPKIDEMETTINVLYSENIISIYTNKVKLQRRLNKLLGEPKKEYMLQSCICGSVWDVTLCDSKILNEVIKM